MVLARNLSVVKFEASVVIWSTLLCIKEHPQSEGSNIAEHLFIYFLKIILNTW